MAASSSVRRLAAFAGLAIVAAAVALLWAGRSPGSGQAAAATARPAKPRPITIAWGGDVTLGSLYGQPPAAGWPLLAPVARVLRAANLAAVNYEGTLGSGGGSKCGARPKPNCFAFQAPARNARSLRRAGIDIVNQANNHAFDFGAVGWHATAAALAAAHVRVTGAPGEIELLRSRENRVAFVGFS